jgi:hypothetical protein
VGVASSVTAVPSVKELEQVAPQLTVALGAAMAAL